MGCTIDSVIGMSSESQTVGKEDPLVVQIAEIGSEDEEYLSMLKSLESEDYELAPDEL